MGATRHDADELYELARLLPERERLRLLERIARDLASTHEPARVRYDWTDLAGVAPGLLDEDAQAWVSRTRRDADERRNPGSGPHR